MEKDTIDRIEFDNAQKGFDYLNLTCPDASPYDLRYIGKNVTRLTINLKDGRPESAELETREGNCYGFHSFPLPQAKPKKFDSRSLDFLFDDIFG